MEAPVPETEFWTILFLPLAAFVAASAVAIVRRARISDGRSAWPPEQLASGVTILAIGVGFVLAVWTLLEAIGEDGHAFGFSPYELVDIGNLSVQVGVAIDGLTAVMLVVVTGVSLLVQIYSTGYMHGDSGYSRYFAYMALFTTSMLGLILADNLLMLFVFWELVGLTSFLLIGFWFHRPAAAAAAKKAFLVTRLGDLGLLAGLILIWDRTGTLNIQEINTDVVEAVGIGLLSQTMLTLFALGLIAGAVGKSAQFPLHIWLPDAMEGPTPVSALVHSATMVAAGVYLLARFFPVLEASAFASDFIAWIGAVTAVGAALLAVVQVDIKRVLAYSTISQLAYMMFALGVGGFAAAVFHLMTHAFFKALLFLGSGSVNHSTNTFDMRKMGGLRRHMPITYATFVIGTLSLAGIIPLAGFWSKDEILIEAWHHNKPVFFFGIAAVGLTAFYMLRTVYMTFHGDYQGGEDAAPGEHGADPSHPHESPRSMTGVLMVLSVLAIVAGFVTFGGNFQTWVLGSLPEGEEGHFEWDTAIFIASTAIALAGIGLATLLYLRRVVDLEKVRQVWPLLELHSFTVNKFYMDWLGESFLVRRVFYRGIAWAAGAFDRRVVDGAVNLAGRDVVETGRWARLVQNGWVQSGTVVLAFGMVLIWASIVIF